MENHVKKEKMQEKTKQEKERKKEREEMHLGVEGKGKRVRVIAIKKKIKTIGEKNLRAGSVNKGQYKDKGKAVKGVEGRGS